MTFPARKIILLTSGPDCANPQSAIRNPQSVTLPRGTTDSK